MKIKTKIAIFLVAVLLSIAEFSMIASCSCFVDILKIGKQAGYEIIANTLDWQADTVSTSTYNL